MEKALSQLAQVQARLDASKSDPKWLNDALAEIKSTLESAQPNAGGAPVAGAEADLSGLLGAAPVQNMTMDLAAVTLLAPMLAQIPFALLTSSDADRRAEVANIVARLNQVASLAAVRVFATSKNREAALSALREQMAEGVRVPSRNSDAAPAS